MLRLTINDQPVDLEGVKFNLQLNSPIPLAPEDGLVEGSFAFGIIFPATPVNKQIFGYPHRLELYPEGETDFPGQLFFNGRLLFNVIVSLTDVSDYYFRANIKVSLGYYKNLIGDLTLRDLAYEGDIALGSTSEEVCDHANAVAASAYPASKYNFPSLRNEKFYGEEQEKNPTFVDVVNYYPVGGFFSNSVNLYTAENFYNLCPFSYLFYILSKCFTEFGYKVTGEVWKDTELASLLVYNNYALDLIQDRYKCVVELTSDQAIPEDTTDLQFDQVNENIDNCYDAILFKYLIAKQGDHHINGHLNFQMVNIFGTPVEGEYTIYLNYGSNVVEILKERGLYPYSFDIDFTWTERMGLADIGSYMWLSIKFIMDPDNLLAWKAPGTIFAGSWFGIQNVPYSQLNVFSKTINIRNHVPNMKISAFLIALQKAFGIVYSFNDTTKTVELLFLKNILSSTQEDDYSEFTTKSSKLAGFRISQSYLLDFEWSSQDGYTEDNFKEYDTSMLIGQYASTAHLPDPAMEGSYALVLNLNAIYRYKDAAWAYYTDYHRNYQAGSGVTQVKIGLSPLMMWAEFPGITDKRIYPKILQEGSSAQLGDNDYGLHLLFYRGMVQDADGNDYPFASVTRYGPTGSVIGNYELILNGTYGIYEIFLEEYYNWLINRSRPVEYDKYFTASQIQALNFIRKKRIFQHLFLIDEITIPMSNTSIGIANVKLQKI